MANMPPIKQVGSEKKLCHLTYGQIAKWAGLAPRSVIQYASRGDFQQSDIESVLRWVNGRRRARGLPLIGQPGENSGDISSEPTTEKPSGGTATQKHRENQPQTSLIDSRNTNCPAIKVGPIYNPETGGFDV